MRIVRAIYDGALIRAIEPLEAKKNTEVFVIIPDTEKRISSREARMRLRGSAKGERLNDNLLKSRHEDLRLEQRQ